MFQSRFLDVLKKDLVSLLNRGYTLACTFDERLSFQVPLAHASSHVRHEVLGGQAEHLAKHGFLR